MAFTILTGNSFVPAGIVIVGAVAATHVPTVVLKL